MTKYVHGTIETEFVRFRINVRCVWTLKRNEINLYNKEGTAHVCVVYFINFYIHRVCW